MRLKITLFSLYLVFCVLLAYSHSPLVITKVNDTYKSLNSSKLKPVIKFRFAPQTITFAALASKSLGASDYSPGATASSGLAIVYSSSNTSVATIVNGQIHIVGLGTTVITATQPGDANYSAAVNVQQPLLVRTIQSGDYVSSGTMNWSGGTWNISDGSGGYSSTTTTPPGAAQNVYILSGHTVTLNAAQCSAKNLTVESGGTLTAAASTNTLVVAGDMVMNGSFLRPAFDILTTVTGDVTIGGTWSLGSLTTGKNVYILSSGIVKGSTTAGGTVQSVKFGGNNPIIQIDGQFGGSGAGLTGESIRVFPTATGTTTFTGIGKVFLARFQPESVASAVQNIVIDIDMNFGNSVTTAVGFTLQNNLTATSNPKTLTVNPGKILKLSSAGGGFHSIASMTESTMSTLNLGNITYNINGILDVSAGHFALYSNNNTSSSAQQITVNVGSGGILKLGANVRMVKAYSTQKINVNVADGGTIDASSAAINLSIAPVSSNAHTTNGSGYSWFTLSANAIYKRLTNVNTAAPLWMGTTNTNYTPVTITPASTTVISAGLLTTRSSVIQDESRAIKTSWKIIPATSSATNITFGFNTIDLNAAANADNTMVLFQQKAAGNAWIPIASAVPVAGNGTDKQVTFSGVTTSLADVNFGLANLSPQTISFAEIPQKNTADTDFDAGATASSGLVINYASSNSTVATIVSGKIHIAGVGTTSITASQNGDISWLAANDVSKTLTVIQGQSITFPALPPKTLTSIDFDANATASSGLAVSYTSSDNSVATIVSGKIHIVGIGTSIITASQPGDATHPAAADVTQILTVKNLQTITFTSLPNKFIGDADFDAGATADSGLPVSYTSSNTSVATIVSGKVHIVGLGTANITADQAGNANYHAAAQVSQTLTITKKSQTITFTSLLSKTVGDADFDAGAISSSGLPISYASSNAAVATIVSGKIHITGAGTTNITATQGGDATWAAADAVTLPLTVNSYSLPTDLTPFVHPGISHKQSDLERMKDMVEAGVDPWKSSFASLKTNPYSSYNYVVRGNPATTVFYVDVAAEYDKFKYDGLAAYNNALMWFITRDSRHANKAIEIFKAWSNINKMVIGGTEALGAGRILWKMVEGAEIIKSTYTGWSQTDIDKFKAMLVYPGYSSSTFPTAAKNSDDVTFYWNMYNGDPGRHGNQGLFAMRSTIAMAIFLDNRTMYDRVIRLLKGLPHRGDDLPYPAGPPIISATPNVATSNEYYDDYTVTGNSNTIQDYGYDEVIAHYIYENGQGEESSRDQGHAFGGVGILAAISEIAWSQGDDLYGFLNNRVLLGLEYALRYNLSYNYSYPDQPTPWEPTAASGEFIQGFERTGRWYAKKINPWNGADLTGLSRGQTQKSNSSPVHELTLAHYQQRMGLPEEKVKWSKRGRDISIKEFGYERSGFEVDHGGWGGLTFRRPDLCTGDPVDFSTGTLIYKMNTLPGTVEAENFDHFNGLGQGKTYNDLTANNSRGAYRTSEGVDIGSDSNGYHVSDMQPGEWINYTVFVPSTGFYKINVNYAAFNGNGKLRIEFNGQDKTGDVVMAYGSNGSGGEQDWKNLTLASEVTLQAGVQSMRIFVGGTEKAFNLNSISIQAVTSASAPVAPADLMAKAGNSQIALSWTASTGASGYQIKRSEVSGGSYTILASGIAATSYTDMKLTNGKTYFYIVSASNGIGESASSNEANGTPDDNKNIIEDNFSTGTGPVTGRIPEDATIGNRVYASAITTSQNVNVVAGGNALLVTNIGEAVNISSDSSFVKPTYLNISSDFDLGTMTNPGVPRPTRSVYIGFWSALPSSGEPFTNMRGVFLNPEDGELQLWNGSGSQTGTPVQTLAYKGTWVPGDAPHSMSYTINTLTGNISEFKLDGVSYLWNKTSIFNNVNTAYAGFGAAAPINNQYAHISRFALKDNKVWNGVDRVPQTITFAELADKKVGDADFDCGASTNLGLPLTYVSSNPAVATIGTDGLIHILASGTTTITASQAGTEEYEAVWMSRTLTINNLTLIPALLVQDDFETGSGEITGRTPEIATIEGRVFQKIITTTNNANIIQNGAAKLTSNIGEVISIASSDSFVKPSIFTIESSFNMGTTTNNTPTPRPARSVYLGFWSALPTSGESIGNLRGVFLNPEDGELQLWNGSSSSTATPVQTLAYQGTWDPSGTITHTIVYTINTSTGNISGFKLDGVAYSWNTTNIFSNVNTNFAGFGMAGAATGQYASFLSFKLSTLAPQEITFNPLPTKKIGDADFDAGASSSAQLTVNYTSSSQNVATIVNGNIHIVGAGTSTITATQPGNGTYAAATSRTRVLTVSKINQIINFSALPEKMVDDNDFSPGATTSSGLTVSYISANTSVATIVNGQIHIIGTAGTSVITASQTGNSTYAIANTVSQTLTVSKKSQSISFSEIDTKTVGDADFDPLAVSSSDLNLTYSSSDPSVATIVNGKIHIVDSGTSTITASQGGNESYLPAATVSQTLTVINQQLRNTNNTNQTITFNSLAKMRLGDADVTLIASSSSGLPITYTSDNTSVATINGNVLTIIGAGNANITASQAGSSGYSPASDVVQTLTVNRANATITLGNLIQMFDGTPKPVTATTSPAGLTGLIITYNGLSTIPTAAGNYTVSATLTNNNYIATVETGSLIISPKTVTVTAAAKSKTYGDADPALTYTFSPTLSNTDSFAGSLTRTAGENVGTYAINQGTLALNSNYNLTYASADLTIAKKAVTVSAAAKSKTYGDADPALTYTFAPALQTGDGFTGSLTRTAGENVGVYAINQGTLSLNSNYTLAYTNANLTIGKKSVTVSAVAKSKTYGDADPALTYTFAPALQTGDGFTGSLTRAVGENVGAYAINQGTLALNSNYNLTYTGANLTIEKKAVMVTASAKSKTYGDADPVLTYTFAPALQTGDDFTGSLTRTAGENVGTYAINQGTIALNSNYNLTYTGANLTIGKKSVTVSAAAKSKTYSDADPALTYTFAPALQTGDGFTGSLTRTAGENAGIYTINLGSITANSNYTITYVPANLTISKAMLTVTANNTLMCRSDGFPTFGVSYSGFLAGDTENVLNTKSTVSSTANRNVAGTYVLVPTGGAADNYNFVYVNGTLTINALPIVNLVSSKGTDISKGEITVLTASGGTSYSWSAANGIVSGQNMAMLTVRPPQTTTYTVRVTNGNGCSSIEAITIKVAEDYKIVANNILTPNGDGVNDTWIIQNIDMYTGNEVRIFDRNGRELYNKKGYDNSWNGTNRGNNLAEGTYYYILTYGPEKRIKKGFITIVRNR